MEPIPVPWNRRVIPCSESERSRFTNSHLPIHLITVAVITPKPSHHTIVRRSSLWSEQKELPQAITCGLYRLTQNHYRTVTPRPGFGGSASFSLWSEWHHTAGCYTSRNTLTRVPGFFSSPTYRNMRGDLGGLATSKSRHLVRVESTVST